MKPQGNWQRGSEHPILEIPPQRVVSLVPSMTKSLFDLELGNSLVGVTDFCSDPADKVKDIPHLGGPKNPRVEDILALKPDLVLMNQEENSAETVEALLIAGIDKSIIWLAFPLTVREAVADLWSLADIFKSQKATLILRGLERILDWTEYSLEEKALIPYFCPIWQGKIADGSNWWMTFNHETYSDDLLRLLGGKNVFAERVRRYPLEADLGLEQTEAAGERDVRYPRVTREEIENAQPEMILLPDEPYNFTVEHQQILMESLINTPAVRNNRVYRLDGKLLFWYGTHLGKSLVELPQYFSFTE